MVDDTQPLNREQRRRQKFHRHGPSRQDNLQTERENNTGFLATPPAPVADEAAAALEESSDEASDHHVGPGTGGETESDEGQPHHEGMHLGR